MSQIRITLFGTPYIEHDGIRIEFVRRKAVALIAYLVLTNQRTSREMLAEFLWPDNDSVRSRASLRRVLSTISETPLAKWIEADREVIILHQNDDLWIDVQQFNTLLAQASTPDRMAQAVTLYTDNFMAGFTLKDSAAFDHWQTSQTQNLQQKLFMTFERLNSYYRQHNQNEKSAGILRQWLHFDPLNEFAQHQLIEFYAYTGQRSAASAQYEMYATLLQNELGISPQLETRQLYERIKREEALTHQITTSALRGNLPPFPSLVVGRDTVVNKLKQCLMNDERQTYQTQVIIQGWPGIGKTTLSAVIAHDEALHKHYRDGILWISLGQHPNLLAILKTWGRALGFYELERTQTVEEATTRLTAFLKDQRLLIILDDVWSVDHASVLRVGGQRSGLMITTRLNDVAGALAYRPENIHKIPILSIDESLILLRTLAPQVIAEYPQEAQRLAADLEGLPLALQVAGRLLQAEMEFGWGIQDLLRELREGRYLLEAKAPADRTELLTETTPTIAALLQRSVNRLTADIQEKFAVLGVFAPKPATFTLEAMQAVWRLNDARPVARILVARGLLEAISSGRFQMHALLVMYAQSMFQD